MKERLKFKELIERWKSFLSYFTLERIEEMHNYDEYVIGKGSFSKSFCYWVEVELKDLGDIRAATSSKFGMWYGKNGKSTSKDYRATKKHFNGNVAYAFNKIKNALINLISATAKLNEFTDLESILSPMFKRKIMFLYNKDIMVPCFSDSDIHFFEKKLNLVISDNYENAQKNLLKYKVKNKPDLSNYEFIAGLYKQYGKDRSRKQKELDESQDYLLNIAVQTKRLPKETYETKIVQKCQPKKAKDGLSYYPRDTKMSLFALRNANYTCENKKSHPCFIKRNNGTPYTEVHHLIPLCFYDSFDVSLDVPENIISLCSNCHNEIHYGRDAERIIRKLYEERKDKLEKAGIFITIDELLGMYENIYKRK